MAGVVYTREASLGYRGPPRVCAFKSTLDADMRTECCSVTRKVLFFPLSWATHWEHNSA